MPIKQIRNDSITQRCAKCGTDRNVRYSELELGVDIDPAAGIKDSNVIALPPCDKCGAREFLLRDWDKCAESETSGRLLHRQAVNRLSKNLKEMEKINTACEEEITSEKNEPTDMLNVELDRTGIDIFTDRSNQE